MASAAEKMVAPAFERPRVEYKIPELFRQFPNDPKSVTLVPLTVREEMQAAKAAQAAEVPDSAVSVEMTRVSVVEVDGKRVDWSTTDPQWLDAASPKCRELIMKAFLRLNRLGQTGEEEKAEADFFASAHAKAG